MFKDKTTVLNFKASAIDRCPEIVVFCSIRGTIFNSEECCENSFMVTPIFTSRVYHSSVTVGALQCTTVVGTIEPTAGG